MSDYASGYETLATISDYERDGCNFCENILISPETFSVMTHESKQAIVTFRFCPACGRKL